MVNNGGVEESAAAEPAPAPGAPRRDERRPRDMALSLAVLLVPIALLLIFYRYALSGDQPATVDPGPAIQEAQSQRAFPVAVPAGLGAAWHVTTATYRRDAGAATLRLGYVAPGGDPVQLIESDAAFSALIPAELGPAAGPAGVFHAGARVWQRYGGRPGEDSLVLFEPGRTIIVVGTGGRRDIEQLASALSG
jgi:Protein of unknown function (DUF4245)